MPARAGRLASRSVTYRSASKADARVSTTRSPPPMKLMWSWRTAIRMGRRMRSPAINARGLARWRAAPPDPVESRVPVVEDLDERRRVELRDHRRIHRVGGALRVGGRPLPPAGERRRGRVAGDGGGGGGRPPPPRGGGPFPTVRPAGAKEPKDPISAKVPRGTNRESGLALRNQSGGATA